MADSPEVWRLTIEPPERWLPHRDQAVRKLTAMGWTVVADETSSGELTDQPLLEQPNPHSLDNDQVVNDLEDRRTGLVVPAVKEMGLRQIARSLFGTTNVGAALATQLLYYPKVQEVKPEYFVTYPVRRSRSIVTRRALRLYSAPALLADYRAFAIERLRLTPNQERVLATVADIAVARTVIDNRGDNL